MSYDRRKTAQTGVKPMGEFINQGLKDLAQAIIREGMQSNRHMTGSIEDKRWYRINIDFDGESLSDLPASGFAMLEFEKGMVTARCTYDEVGGLKRDSHLYMLKMDEDPSHFIKVISDFLVGV
jgi:hypothetical protein